MTNLQPIMVDNSEYLFTFFSVNGDNEALNKLAKVSLHWRGCCCRSVNLVMITGTISSTINQKVF